jgi:hypothetical protein
MNGEKEKKPRKIDGKAINYSQVLIFMKEIFWRLLEL